jgi:hypothetical protein
MDNISKDTKKLFDKCNAIELLNKMADGIIFQLAPDIHINIDLSSFENALKQHKFSIEGKFHFLTALQLNYSSKDTFQTLNNFISEQRDLYYEGMITEDCFEKIIKQILTWFEDELKIKEFKINLFSIKCGDENINNEEIIFLLFEYIYKSPTLSEVYSFDKLDVRRQALYRLEYIAYSFLQQTKIFIKSTDDEIIDKLKFNYTIEECIEYIRFKEVELRRDFINEFFFNLEHFLSSIRKQYNIKENINLDKKDLIKEIFEYFQIDIKVELEEIKEKIIQRCNETDNKIINIFDGKNIKKDFIFYHTLFIQLRNSLHSNGTVSKNIQKFKLGKINFTKLEKGKFHNSMSIVHLISLALIEIIAIEKIIEKTIPDTLIKDEYMIELDKLLNYDESQLSSSQSILKC